MKETIVKKLQGWKQSPLCEVGREILIKAMACAIPINAMSLFKFPRFNTFEWILSLISSSKGKNKEKEEYNGLVGIN